MTDAHRHRSADRLAVILLVVLTLVFFWRILLLGEVLLPLDMIYTWEPWYSEATHRPDPPIWNPIVTDSIWQFVPMASYASQAWSEGSPFWDPYVLSGLPALARGEMFSNVFYHALSLALPLPYAMSFSALIHLLLGSLFMFLLLREMGLRQFGSLVGSLSFAFNTYLIGWLPLPVVTGSMVWIPLVFLGVERALRRRDWRWLLLGSLGYAFQILEGHILWPFYTAYVLGGYVAYKSLVEWWRQRSFARAIVPLVCGGVVLAVGAALVAPQLASTVELYFQTNRTQATSAGSLIPLKQLIRLLVPDFYGVPIHGNAYWGYANYTETDLYFGVLPLVFVAVACVSDRRVLAWGVTGMGLCALLAAYGIAPFTQIVQLVCPVFLNTFPGRIFFATAFLWAMAAAIGADWIERARPERFLRFLSPATGALAGAMLLLGFWVARVHGPKGIALGSTEFHNVEYMRISSILLCVTWLAGGALLFGLWRRGKLPRPVFVGLGLMILVLDVFPVGMRYNPTFDRDFLFPETPSLLALKELGRSEPQPYRILGLGTLPAMSAEYYRLPVIGGYSSFVLRRYADYTQAAGKPAGTLNYVYVEDCCNKLLDALNVRYVHTWPGFELDDDDLTLIYEGPNDVYRNEKALPRAWLVHRLSVFAAGDTDAVKQRLAAPDFDPRDEALVEGPAGAVLGQASAGDRVRVDSYEAQRVELSATLGEPGFLVMSDTMYPGWRAYVDEQERPIYTTNLFMRGLYLEAGEHRVVFEYEPETFWRASYVTAVVLLLIAGLLLKGRKLGLVRSPRS